LKVFITGGTGFIGSHLMGRLIQLDCNITHLVRKADVVYHLAGVTTHGLSYDKYWGPHVGMVRELIETLNCDQKFVYVSTAYVDYPEGFYEQTKIEGEEVVRSSKVAYSIIRPGPVYGPRSLSLLKLCKWLTRLGRFFPIVGSGKNRICPVYIDDVIDFLIEAPLGEYYITGKPITMSEFISQVAEAVSVQKPFIHIPAVAYKKFFTIERVFNSDVKTKISLREGLERTVQWYRRRGYL